MDRRQRAISRAREYLGTPFHHQGRSYAGIDCVGLLVHAYEIPEEFVPDYPRDPYDGKLEAALEAVFGPPMYPDQTELEPGDVVAMAYAGVIRHVGIIGHHPQYGLTLIHTDSGIGKVVEHPLTYRWANRIKRIFR